MKNTITRSEYLKGSNLHRQYYSQFVNQEVKEKVIREIGLKALLKSKDKHLNDIPLKKWDKLGGFVWGIRGGSEVAIEKPRTTSDILPVDYELLKEVDGGISSSTMVCIYKEAARQIIEEHSNK